MAAMTLSGKPYIFPAMKDRCPFSGLPVYHDPHWSHVGQKGNYVHRFSLIGDHILHSEPMGSPSLQDAQHVLVKMQQVMAERLGPDAAYVHISDFTNSKNVSSDVRKYFIEHFKHNTWIKGIVYYGVSSILHISINLAYRLNLIPFKVHITDTYKEAVQLALELLEAQGPASGDNTSLATKDQGDVAGDNISAEMQWEFVIDQRYKVRFGVCEPNLFLSQGIGHLEAHHVNRIFEHQEEVFCNTGLKNGDYYFLVDVKELRGASLKGRRLYFDHIRKWHVRHPFHAYFFCGVNDLIRAAINVARHFVDFDVIVSADFDEAVNLIRSREADAQHIVSSELPEIESEDDKSDFTLALYVEEMLQFLGYIGWDTDDFQIPIEVRSDHPFRTVFEALELIRSDFDELITERNRVSENLRQRTEFIEAVAQSLPLGLCVARMETWEVIYTNSTFHAICGWGKTSLGTLHDFFDKVMGRLDLKDEMQQVSVPSSSPKAVRLEWTDMPIMTANHTSKYATIITTPMIEQQLLITTIMDVSDNVRVAAEKDKLQSQLYQSQKMEAVGTLAGGVAHDFNNILAAIMGYIEIAMADMDSSTLRHKTLDKALQASHRAKDLVRQILAYSRKDTGGQIPVKPDQIAKEALELIRASLPSNIEIQTDFAPDCGMILADPSQIHQVLLNLCVNASHAMEPEGGVLGLSVTKLSLEAVSIEEISDITPGDHVRLAVSDSGHGIDTEILDRIFDPYFTTKEHGKGTGMGLSVVHGIVRNHHGAVRVRSSPGEGTTFSILLPCIEQQEQTEPIEDVRLPKGRERILLVDDEMMIVDMGRQVLERLGYRVTFRTDAMEALEEFRRDPQNYDLVISDLTMPYLTGDRLAAELLNIRDDIKIILCTGYSSLMDEARTSDLRISAFLDKPVSIHEMARTVREVLDQT